MLCTACQAFVSNVNQASSSDRFAAVAPQALALWGSRPDQRTMHTLLRRAQLKWGRFDDATLTNLAAAVTQLGYR